MTKKVAFVLESDDLQSAHVSMESLGVHHVPVVRDGIVVGILSDRDVLLHGYPTKNKHMGFPSGFHVRDVMTAPVITCNVNTTIRAAANQMIESRIHCLPVTESGGKLVGIITATDLLRLLTERNGQELDEPLPFHFTIPSPLAQMFEE